MNRRNDMDISVKQLSDAKRILIIGDAGVGKTTIATRLSDQLDLPLYGTDDVLWLKKYTELRDRNETARAMNDIYSKDRWIVEGTTRRLLQPGVDRAEVVFYFGFRTIFQQYRNLIRRFLGRPNETTLNLLQLLWHVTKKRLSSRTPVLLKMVQTHPRVVKGYYPINIVE